MGYIISTSRKKLEFFFLYKRSSIKLFTSLLYNGLTFVFFFLLFALALHYHLLYFFQFIFFFLSTQNIFTYFINWYLFWNNAFFFPFFNGLSYLHYYLLRFIFHSFLSFHYFYFDAFLARKEKLKILYTCYLYFSSYIPNLNHFFFICISWSIILIALFCSLLMKENYNPLSIYSLLHFDFNFKQLLFWTIWFLFSHVGVYVDIVTISEAIYFS